jgi:hypothetical protein
LQAMDREHSLDRGSWATPMPSSRRTDPRYALM